MNININVYIYIYIYICIYIYIYIHICIYIYIYHFSNILERCQRIVAGSATIRLAILSTVSFNCLVYFQKHNWNWNSICYRNGTGKLVRLCGPQQYKYYYEHQHKRLYIYIYIYTHMYIYIYICIIYLFCIYNTKDPFKSINPRSQFIQRVAPK